MRKRGHELHWVCLIVELIASLSIFRDPLLSFLKRGKRGVSRLPADHLIRSPRLRE